MYTLVRYYIKTSLVFLLLGVLAGLHLLVHRHLLFIPYRPGVVNAHVHVLLVGFLLMMVMGVALWMFPRPGKEDSHYKPGAANVCYWLLTVGTALRFITEWFTPTARVDLVNLGVVVGGTAQAVAVVLFVWNMWTRIRPIGSHLREAKGERF